MMVGQAARQPLDESVPETKRIPETTQTRHNKGNARDLSASLTGCLDGTVYNSNRIRTE